MNQLKLFCFPYAGGNANFYFSLKTHISPNIQIIPIEYSGHGSRFNEPLSTSRERFLEDVFSQVEENFDDSPYAVLGYSLGTVVAHDIIDLMLQEGYRAPMHAFFSALLPPHFNTIHNAKYLLENHDLFYENIVKMNGIPNEVQENQELMELFLPIIYNDLKIYSEHVYQDSPKRFKFDISIFYSQIDDYNQHMDQWALYTEETCFLHKFNGDHFFIKNHWEEIAEEINNTMNKK